MISFAICAYLNSASFGPEYSISGPSMSSVSASEMSKGTRCTNAWNDSSITPARITPDHGKPLVA